mgnify:CR=1 FL=1
MKQKLIDFIKFHPFIFFLYNHIGSLLLKIIGIFIPIKKKKILFVSFGGKKYDDSPQSIYEKMITMPEFNDYEFIWAFTDINKKIPGNAKLIKIDSFNYFYHALSSKFWIINVSAERGLNFKKKKTICINTWHGTPIKKIYGEENANLNKKLKRKPEKFDLVCAQSKYDQKIFSRIFNIPIENVIISDLPRNDCIIKYTNDNIVSIKRKLNIPLDKKVILYMPTYREYTRDENNACYFIPPIDLKKWQNKLGQEYVLLFRAHYLVIKEMKFKENEFVKNVSSYSQLSELYAISDIMISDYSSAFFDFSILQRPMFCFAYDFDEYSKKRGFYIDLKSELPCSIDFNEDTLIQNIINMDYLKKIEQTKEFKNKYVPVSGNATENVINEIKLRFM